MADITDVAVPQDQRRQQMLRAALDVIVERGFPDTRIADVAERAEVSPALVIYYFKTKDRLLTEALRYAEDRWYDEGARRTAQLPSAALRLEQLISMTCLPSSDLLEESWVIWLDLWATAVRHAEVRQVRAESDERWRATIRTIVEAGQAAGEFQRLDIERFVIGFSALLDGLAIQIALEDPVVEPQTAFEIAMGMASDRLGFDWAPPAGTHPASRRAASTSSGPTSGFSGVPR